MLKLAPALLVLALAGCAAPKYNYQAQATAFSEPPIGVITTAAVGDKMLSQGVSVRQEGLEVKAPAKISLGFTVGPGLYTKTGQDDAAEYFVPKLGDGGGTLLRASGFFELPMSIMLKTDGQLCVITISTQFVCGVAPEIERRTVESTTERTFQQTLLYSGKIGNKINIGYREFSANVSRMGFNNDVEYDLSDSMIIGYKGAEIEVMEANNRSIRYKVIKNFNSASR